MIMPMPRLVFEDKPLLSTDIKPWIDLANKQTYAGGHPAEGIVVKTSDDKIPYMSFKVISPEYLLKYNI
jgi:hypothetical protein